MDLKQRDGRVVPFEVSSVGVRRDGVFAGIQGAARDIAERERLERELRECEERYRFLVENSPDVVFATDAEGKLHVPVRDDRAMVGFSPAELVGAATSRGSSTRRSLPAAPTLGRRSSAQPDRMQVVRLDPHPQGRPTRCRSRSARSATLDRRRFAGIHGSTRDISERERLETRPPPPGRRAGLEPGAGPPRPRAPRLGHPGAVLDDPRHPDDGAPRRPRRREGQAPARHRCATSSARRWPRCGR